MKTLIIHGSKNHKGKRDATGAFIPEARAFAKMHEVHENNVLALDCIKNRPFARRRRVSGFFAKHDRAPKTGMIAIFCHGWTSGLQIGFGKKRVPELVEMLDHCCRRDVKIVLYACSTAGNKSKGKAIGPGTNGGFADLLRDEMLRRGFRGGWIDAHLTPGHTTRNPYVVRFLTEPIFENEFDVPGGQWLIQPKTKLWEIWKKELRKGFRFRFPFYHDYEISGHLAFY